MKPWLKWSLTALTVLAIGISAWLSMMLKDEEPRPCVYLSEVTPPSPLTRSALVKFGPLPKMLNYLWDKDRELTQRQLPHPQRVKRYLIHADQAHRDLAAALGDKELHWSTVSTHGDTSSRLFLEAIRAIAIDCLYCGQGDTIPRVLTFVRLTDSLLPRLIRDARNLADYRNCLRIMELRAVLVTRACRTAPDPTLLLGDFTPEIDFRKMLLTDRGTSIQELRGAWSGVTASEHVPEPGIHYRPGLTINTLQRHLKQDLASSENYAAGRLDGVGLCNATEHMTFAMANDNSYYSFWFRPNFIGKQIAFGRAGKMIVVHALDILSLHDLMQIAVACERFHRKHHTLPATLSLLEPEFLPDVPTDRWTGGELGYACDQGIVWDAGYGSTSDAALPPFSWSVKHVTARDITKRRYLLFHP